MGLIIEKAHGLASRPLNRNSIGLVTGIMAAGISAGSEWFQFRWTSTSKLALVRRVLVSAGNLGTAFAAGGVTMDLIRSTAWTAAGTGGTAATITAPNGLLYTNFEALNVGEMRIATTAALGAGTKTLDAHPLGAACSSVPNVAGSPAMPSTDLIDARKEDEYPLILGANEGFSVRATVPATGTWTGAVQVQWDELSPK